MIKIVHGDLFDSEMKTLTNAINCVGVMGAGIALAFAKRYPAMLKEYEELCAKDEVRVDEPYLWPNPDPEGHNVLNFPTMYYPGEEAHLGQILRAFDHVIAKKDEWDLGSLAVPALGCGIGGLLFDDIKDPISEKLKQLEIPVEIYPPYASADLFPYR